MSSCNFSAAAAGAALSGSSRLLGGATLSAAAPMAASATSIIPPLPPEPTDGRVVDEIILSPDTRSQYTVAAGTTLIAGGTVGPIFGLYDGPTTRLTNDGTLWAHRTGPGNSSGVIGGGAIGRVVNNGLIVSISEEWHAVGIESLNYVDRAGSVVNNGRLFVVSNGGDANGIFTYSTHALINNGLIAVTAKTNPLLPNDPWKSWQSGTATGIRSEEGSAYVTNGADGRILVEGDRAIGVWTRGTHPSAKQPFEVSNAGFIKAVSTEAGITSVGLFLAGITGNHVRVINSGTIEADQAILAPSSGWDAAFARMEYTSEDITNTATGIIRGSVELRNGDDRLSNAGRIAGFVDMGPGEDVVYSPGSISGIVYLGLGADVFEGGEGSDRVTGERDDDHIHGNGGIDLLLGGPGDDVVVGGGGSDGLYGEHGNDRIVTRGGDLVEGGAGNDRLEVGDYAFRKVDGGDGFDTIVLPSGARILDLRAALSTTRIADFEEILLGGGKHLVVRASDVSAATDSGELRIGATATDHVHLLGTWVTGESRSLDGIAYRAYSSGEATVLVQQGATVLVGGKAPAGAAGLDPVGAGIPPDPSANGLPVDTGFSALFDPIELAGALRIESYEVWHSMEGNGLVSFKSELEWAELVNAGTMLTSGTDRLNSTIALYQGDVRNSGTIWAENNGLGAARTILIGAVGQLFNTGEIFATAQSGTALAVHTFDSDDAIEGRNGIENIGLISAVSDQGWGIAVATHNSMARVLNEGTIQASGGRGAIAVDMGNAGGTLVNRGEIYATAPLTSDFPSIGFYADGHAELINSGIVSAEIAVLVQLRQVESFDLVNSGVIDGTIYIGQYRGGGLYGWVVIQNDKNIFGDIFSDPDMRTRETIVNRGRIDGNISLAGGDDSFDGSRGRQFGVVAGEDGNDTLIGGSRPDRLLGGNGDDTLSAGSGNDLLDGGTGFDSMTGGSGDDRYVVDSLGDKVIESADGGVDRVDSAVDFELAPELEHLRLIGSAPITGIGNTGDNRLTGNAAANTLRGGRGDDFLDGGGGADTMEGGGDDDVYVVDDSADRVVELTGGGIDKVSSSVTFALGNNVEQLTLTGRLSADAHGNGLDNILTGNSAANLLDGRGGSDRMAGGRGNDTYVVDGRGDIVVEAAGAGTDSVRTSISYALGQNLENLFLIGNAAIDGIGNGLDNAITGNAAANALSGGGGNDVLDGRGGSDAMSGGAGNDIYFVDSAADKVIETRASDGIDTVSSAVSFSLGSHVENLVLTGGAAIGTGNSLANLITGNAGANLLSGGGGADIMKGGAGNDVYIVDNAGDKAVETRSGDGFDKVKTSVSYTLGAYVEELVLTGTAANGTGNGLVNKITGNSAANVLDGKGGADTMTGRAGNDSYFVDNVGDKVVEAAGGGIDTVTSSVSYTLPANVEKLVLSGDAVKGIGNSAANRITGNSGANLIDGKAGADTMIGGAGDDTYTLDNAADLVTELAGGGIDTMQGAIGFALAANVENLLLTGSGAVNGTGNALANTLTGNAAGNTLKGSGGDDTVSAGGGDDKVHGGLGADELKGGTGDDGFFFDTALGSGNVDSILDFVVSDDTIHLSRSIFTKAGPAGALAPGAFRTGTAAADAGDRIVYDPATGHIYYDPDGSGGGAQIHFATIGANKPLTSADFLIYG